MSDHTKTNLITLTRHVLHDQHDHSEATGDLTLLLTSIQLGCKFVATSVRKAGLVHLTGLAGTQNIQGEAVKKLDVLANEIFKNSLISSGKVSLMVSEEDDLIITVPEEVRGPYAVVFDPLDGSSNIDAGVNIGTIFGIYKLPSEALKRPVTVQDILLPGTKMCAAGYSMYGSSCALVLTTGHGVNGYTLDSSIGEFILTHPNIRIPDRAAIYSVNEGNSMYWDAVCTKYVGQLKFPKDGSKPYSARYIGSMVADVHRTLLYGGVFMYPRDKKAKSGKLRLLYECFPMAMIMEQAGGLATTGHGRILEIVPKGIHERSGIFLGSRLDIEEIEQLYKQEQ